MNPWTVKRAAAAGTALAVIAGCHVISSVQMSVRDMIQSRGGWAVERLMPDPVTVAIGVLPFDVREIGALPDSDYLR
jgi:hypothetical protein